MLEKFQLEKDLSITQNQVKVMNKFSFFSIYSNLLKTLPINTPSAYTQWAKSPKKLSVGQYGTVFCN